MCYISVTEVKIVNLKKEGKMRMSTLIFIYTIQCTQNFIILNQVVAEKIMTKKKQNVHMCYIGVTEGKIEKAKMSSNIFIFIYTIHLAYLKVYTKF